MIHWAIYLVAVDGQWTWQQPKKWDTGSEIYSSVSKQQENMNKLWRKQQFWVSCMDTVAPQNCQKKLCCVSLLRATTADPQVTLPELTRSEQTAFPPPGMSVSQSLRIWISHWRFWLTSWAFITDICISTVRHVWNTNCSGCLFSLFKEYFTHTEKQNLWSQEAPLRWNLTQTYKWCLMNQKSININAK